jgi:uncharacterized membrane protein
MSGVLLAARLVLAGVFAVAAVAKLADRRSLTTTLREFGFKEPMVGPLSIALPAVELVIAVLLVPASTAVAGAIAAFALLAAFSLVVARALARHERPDCNCFGRAYSAPIGPGTLVRNGVLGAVAATVAIAGPGESLATVDPSAEAIFGVAVVAAIAVLAWFNWQLFRQNGRLIERVRALEAAEPAEQMASDGRHPLAVNRVHARARVETENGVGSSQRVVA